MQHFSISESDAEDCHNIEVNCSLCNNLKDVEAQIHQPPKPSNFSTCQLENKEPKTYTCKIPNERSSNPKSIKITQMYKKSVNR